MSGTPSELAQWATNNVAQYRRQILFGKNGRKNYQESIDKYLGTIKLIKEEVVADGDSDHNPYAKRWDEHLWNEKYSFISKMFKSKHTF